MIKAIIDNVISAASASSENTNYAASNVLNKHPKRAWKAVDLVNDARLTLTIDGPVSEIGVVNTNATAAYVSKTTTSDMGWTTPDGDAVEWVAPDGSVLTFESGEFVDSLLSLVDTGTGDMWTEISSYGAGTMILRLVTDYGETLRAGVVVAGVASNIPAQQWPIDENLIDYSVEDTLSNGSHYYRKGNIVREYSFDALMDRDTDALTVMRDIGMAKGKEPIMWRLTSFEHSQWIVYGRLEVSQTHNYARNTVTMKITEAV